MRDATFAAPIRDDNPCHTCPDSHKRPECRKGCEKDAAWHEELARIKNNCRKYEEQLGIGLKRK